RPSPRDLLVDHQPSHPPLVADFTLLSRIWLPCGLVTLRQTFVRRSHRGWSGRGEPDWGPALFASLAGSGGVCAVGEKRDRRQPARLAETSRGDTAVAHNRSFCDVHHIVQVKPAICVREMR